MSYCRLLGVTSNIPYLNIKDCFDLINPMMPNDNSARIKCNCKWFGCFDSIPWHALCTAPFLFDNPVVQTDVREDFFFFLNFHMLGTILISMLTVSKNFITIFGWSTKTHLFSSSFILCAFFCLRLLFVYRYSVIKHSYADCVSAFSHIDGLKSMRFVLIEWLREILNRNEYKMCL